MKKALTALLLSAVILSAFIHVFAYNTQVTFGGKIYLSDFYEVPEDGLPVTVFVGKKISGSAGGGTVPTISLYDSLGYDGTSISIPAATKMLQVSKSINILAEETFTVPSGQSSIDYLLDASITTRLSEEVSDSDLSKYYIGYKIDTDTYVGSYYRQVSKLQTDFYVTDTYIKKKVSINGKITVPEHKGDIDYTVVAEANRRKYYDESGNYTVDRDYVFKTEGTIAADETEAFYSITALPGKNYTVYIVFDNKEYIRQEKDIEVQKEDVSVNFDNFEKSKTYRGTVKLPDGMDVFTDIKGKEIDVIEGVVSLQASTAPYYYLGSYYFQINHGKKTASFTLKDDIGADGVIIYFHLNSEVKDVFDFGNYKNDSETVPTVAEVGEITSPRDDITVCIPKGKTVYPTIDYESSNLSYKYLMRIIPQTDKTQMKDYKNADYTLRCYSFDYEETESGRRIKTYNCTLPENCGYCIAIESDYYENVLYANDDGFYEDFEKAKFYTATDNPYLVLGDYSPAVSFIPFDKPLVGKNDDSSYFICFRLRNRSDSDYDNLLGSFALFDENGKLLYIASGKYEIAARDYLYATEYFDGKLLENAKYLKFFLWGDGVNPVAQTQYLDNFEVNNIIYPG